MTLRTIVICGVLAGLAFAAVPILPAERYLWAALLYIPLALLSLTDLKTYRLPDVLTLPLILAGLVFSYLGISGFPDFLSGLIGAAAGYLFVFLVAFFYRRLRGREGIGLGDAKLLAAGGAWLGLLYLPFVLLLASVAGLVFSVLSFGRSASLRTVIPFGPFLAVGIWLVWLMKAASILVLVN